MAQKKKTSGVSAVNAAGPPPPPPTAEEMETLQGAEEVEKLLAPVEGTFGGDVAERRSFWQAAQGKDPNITLNAIEGLLASIPGAKYVYRKADPAPDVTPGTAWQRKEDRIEEIMRDYQARQPEAAAEPEAVIEPGVTPTAVSTPSMTEDSMEALRKKRAREKAVQELLGQ